MSRLTAAVLAALLIVSPAPPRWQWPVDDVRVIAPFEAPPHRYGPGHRGIDVAATGQLRAVADGVVAFAGTVADRAVITVDHGDGWVLTLEPVVPAVSSGQSVRRGDVIAEAAAGGHAPAGAVHIGVRKDGEYVSPMLLFGEVPRAVLLPCC